MRKSQTINSKHLPGPDGKARAADCAPGPIDWNDIERFSKLNDLIQRAAKELDVKRDVGRVMAHAEGLTTIGSLLDGSIRSLDDLYKERVLS